MSRAKAEAIIQPDWMVLRRLKCVMESLWITCPEGLLIYMLMLTPDKQSKRD